jgi:hypothetical protein
VLKEDVAGEPYRYIVLDIAAEAKLGATVPRRPEGHWTAEIHGVGPRWSRSEAALFLAASRGRPSHLGRGDGDLWDGD